MFAIQRFLKGVILEFLEISDHVSLTLLKQSI